MRFSMAATKVAHNVRPQTAFWAMATTEVAHPTLVHLYPSSVYP